MSRRATLAFTTTALFGLVIGQQYIQRFEYRGAISKSEFDQAWSAALQTFAKSGNWGGVETGVHHIKTYGTDCGGYALIEIDGSGGICALSGTLRG
jgi:hypothetical protein